MKPTLVHLPPELIESLDTRAAAEGVSRSQLIRDAVGAFLEVDAAARLADQVRQAYERQPLDTPDEWGDLESFLAAVRAEKVRHP
jgi:metal-responsive CopG/Arc/MetJ family transcriptional regulator